MPLPSLLFNIIPEQLKQIMNPQPEQELERRLQKLEAELNPGASPSSVIPQSSQTLQPQRNNSQNVQGSLNRFINWFNGRSSWGKLIVISVAAVVGFAILRAILKLVAAVISLAVLAALLYLVYKFALARSGSKN